MPLRLSFEISKAQNSPRLSNFASNLQIRCKPSTTAVLSYHLSSSQASHHRDHKFTLSNFKQAHNSFLLFYKLPWSRCLFLAINSYRAPTADLRGKKTLHWTEESALFPLSSYDSIGQVSPHLTWSLMSPYLLQFHISYSLISFYMLVYDLARCDKYGRNTYFYLLLLYDLRLPKYPNQAYDQRYQCTESKRILFLSYVYLTNIGQQLSGIT